MIKLILLDGLLFSILLGNMTNFADKRRQALAAACSKSGVGLGVVAG